MIKNIFFDLDGTVVDTAEGVIEGLRIAMIKYGYDIPSYDVLRTCIGPPFSDSFRRVFHVDEKDYDAVISAYREFYENGGMFKCRIYPGIEDLLQELVKRGYSLNICSSKPEESCKMLLDKLNLSKYFSDIVGATKDGRIDSKEEVIDECFRRAPWKHKDETILIGDTKYDAIGATNRGISCIGITWGFGTKQELIENGAVEVFDETSEILEYVTAN